MKNIKMRNFWILFISMCFICSLFFGLFVVLNKEQNTAFADTGADSGLRYTLYNDNKEYKVAAMNRQITEAVIPSYYNGLPVTEVADNAFMSCALLERVEIPETVTRVGNNAFYNCRDLQKLVGMINVTEIGNNAFAMCSKVEKLIIPPKVEKLGSSIIRNVTNPVYVRSTKTAIMSLNANWNLNSSAKIIYGNDLICSQILDENGDVSGYSIDSWQVLKPDYDYTLLCSYKYKECNNIECLDPECTNIHNEQYYPITNIDKDAFNGNEFNSLTLKYDDKHIDYHYPINVCSQAFMGIFADSINIEVDITLDDPSSDSDSFPETEKGTSMSVFAGSTVKSITLPDTLDRIPRSMFALCFDLKYIHNTNPYIGANTLSNKIVSIDTNAFEYCTALELLNIPNTVQYIGNAAFDYWGSSDTKQLIKIDLYKSADIWDKNWTGQIESNASIKFYTMPVVFEKQEGEGGSNNVDVIYGQAMPEATAPTRLGYNFDGYYSAQKGQGDKYYDKDMVSVQTWNRISAATILYANWIPKTYNVILADGVQIEVTFGENMPNAPMPTLEEKYKFDGYMYNGTLYYDKDMSSVHVWDITEDNIELEIVKSLKQTNVHLNDGQTVIATFGEPMPEAKMPSNVIGRVFTGYSYNGTLYYNADMSSAHVWNIDIDEVTLTYESEELVTQIIYNLNGGTNAAGNKTSLRYSETLILQNPEKRGFVFDGWYLNGDKVSVLNQVTESKITLSAKWIGSVWYPTSSTNKINATGVEYLILQLSSNFAYGCTIKVSPDVKQLYIFSSKASIIFKLNIVIEDRPGNFDLILENISIKSIIKDVNPAEPAIAFKAYGNNILNLYTYGTVNIYGGDSANNTTTGSSRLDAGDANCAIMCPNITIHRATNLNIYGGNGGNGGNGTTGVKGGKGGNGGYAIWADNSINICTNNVTLIGGKGGNGGSGNGGDYSGSIITQIQYMGASGQGSVPYIVFNNNKAYYTNGYTVTLENGKNGT